LGVFAREEGVEVSMSDSFLSLEVMAEGMWEEGSAIGLQVG
jgi:hypothetical protein